MLTFGSGRNVTKAFAIGNGSSITGSVAETTLATITIPAGMLGTTGMLRITTVWSFSGASGTRTTKIKFGGTQFGGLANASTVGSATSLTIISNTSATTQVGWATGSAVGIGAAATSPITGAINTAAAADIVITVTLANSGDTATLEHYSVEVIK